MPKTSEHSVTGCDTAAAVPVKQPLGVELEDTALYKRECGSKSQKLRISEAYQSCFLANTTFGGIFCYVA